MMPGRIVQLHVPAHGATFDELMITPSMEFKHFVESAKATFRAYNIKDVLEHDINGKPLHGKDGYPSPYDAIAHGERILIAISKDETISAEPPLEAVLYLEDNSLPKAWRKMGRESRRNHIGTFERTDAIARKNVVRVTLPHADIMEMLHAISHASAAQMKRQYSVRNSERIIKQNWDLEMEFESEPAGLAALAAFSGATSGQGIAVLDMVVDAQLSREERELGGEEDDLQFADVEAVVQILYEKAGALDSVWPETTENKAVGKKAAQKKDLSKTKAKKKEIAVGFARDEELGEDAAAAAKPGSKGYEVADLAGRLSKASVPDNRMLESDSDEDEDPVRPPGRIRGGQA